MATPFFQNILKFNVANYSYVKAEVHGILGHVVQLTDTPKKYMASAPSAPSTTTPVVNNEDANNENANAPSPTTPVMNNEDDDSNK
jgi:hypothetical protein